MEKVNFEIDTEEFLIRVTGKHEYEILNDFIEKNKKVPHFKEICGLLKKEKDEHIDYFKALEIAKNWNCCANCPVNEQDLNICPSFLKYTQIKIDEDGNSYYQLCKFSEIFVKKQKINHKNNNNGYKF